MPFVNVRTAKGLLTHEQKQELHRRITEVMVEVEGRGNPGFRPYVMVLIEEHDATAWSVHGQNLSAAEIEQLRKSL